jgi:hypothetical protein
MLQEQYRQQYHPPQQSRQPQLALGNGFNGSRQPDSSVIPQQPSQYDSYQPMQRPAESPFLRLQQESSNQPIPTSQPGQQPTSQPMQSLLTQWPPSQPTGVHYGDNSQQLFVVQKPQNRVVIPAVAGNSSRVQTGRLPVTPESFNNEAPTFDPYQTQVAAVPPSQHYDNAPATSPSVPTSSPSLFGLFGTRSQ